jgi:hypothetical protein
MKYLGFHLLCVVMLCSCSKKTASADLPDPDAGKWVSVGILDTDDTKRRIDFFDAVVTDAHVACYPEGWPACQVMVPTGDVERIHAFLKTNAFKETAFHSIWTNR